MNFLSEAVADIPLIFEFCKKLRIVESINENFPTHGNHNGLSNGELVVGWLTHALTENNHCKSPVDEWANKHKMILQGLFDKLLSNNEFDDCRLSRLLEKFSDDKVWHNCEKSFYKDSISILQLDTDAPNKFKDSSCATNEGITKTIKCDSTTTYGHHTATDDGIMQRGWSKDHRPDLPQLKLMVSVEGNTGTSIASKTVSGNTNDDLLYIPIIEKTRDIIDTFNCLYCGDCKMSSLEIRANISQYKEFFLTPLQINNNTIKKEFNRLVNIAVNEDQSAQLIFSDNNPQRKAKLIGAGFEISRGQSYKFQDGKFVEWEERLLLIRSSEHAKSEIEQFEKKIKKIKEDLINCASKKSKDKEEAEKELNEKIGKIASSEELRGLFDITSDIQKEVKQRSRTEIRNEKKREGTFEVTTYKVRVTDVRENKEKIDEIKSKLGWRLYVTNAPKQYLTFSMAYTFYRETMYVVEIGFHRVKDYLNISPLFVKQEEQIIGMTRFLMLALKVLTLMTAEIRTNMKKNKIVLQGLYAGQKARMHEAPTGECILKYFSRQSINIIGVKQSDSKLDEDWTWMIAPLSETCKLILQSLQIQEGAYDHLPERIKNAYLNGKNDKSKIVCK